MAEYCKVCGVLLKTSNTVDYRPGSCRDCELERKKLYSGLSVDFGSAKSTKRSKVSKKKGRKKLKVATTTRKSKRRKTDKKLEKKRLKLFKLRLKKQKMLKAKRLAKLKKLGKIRAQREKKRKKLRAKIEKVRKLRTKKLLRFKIQKRKQKERDRREKERIKQRIRKAKERERKLLQKERERLKKEKEKLRQIIRQEKERIRSEKRAEKERIRAEKLRIKLEKQQEKERLKQAKEAAKLALIQAREHARQAAQEARRLREESKKPPLVSVVTKLKEIQPPPDAKVISATPKEKLARTPQPTKILDPKKPAVISGTSASLIESATTIPAKANMAEEKDLLKQSVSAQHSEIIQKEVEKLQKDADPIIDRYNPYTQKVENPDAPRPPSPTPWMATSFRVRKGEFEETKQEEGQGASSGLSDDQVKGIIEKIKNEHKRKTT